MLKRDFHDPKSSDSATRSEKAPQEAEDRDCDLKKRLEGGLKEEKHTHDQGIW